ncbi:MAG: NAD(P)H-dependent oxidoreductase subunit E [Gemmatimonadota bacterium]|nr:MAG: NAD(P)H-dependent oxidoreductase subunit E [Gemmatimonadota bacterium]
MSEDAASIIEKHQQAGNGLISVLEDIQAKFGYLPESALKEVAERTNRSLVDIYGVATFYRAFSLHPRGKHHIAVCSGTACHVRGGPRIAEEVQRQLGIAAGQTTADREFTLETVACLGACALGPIITVDGHYFSNVRTSGIREILDNARAGLDIVEVEGDDRIFPVEVSCPRCNHSLMDTEHLVDGLPAIRVTIAFNQKHGWLLLSSLYGSYNVSSEFPIPQELVAHFFCPHCHAELLGGSHCAECAAPMVPMIVRGGGIVQICSRRGCKGHMLDLSGVNV